MRKRLVRSRKDRTDAAESGVLVKGRKTEMRHSFSLPLRHRSLGRFKLQTDTSIKRPPNRRGPLRRANRLPARLSAEKNGGVDDPSLLLLQPAAKRWLSIPAKSRTRRSLPKIQPVSKEGKRHAGGAENVGKPHTLTTTEHLFPTRLPPVVSKQQRIVAKRIQRSGRITGEATTRSMPNATMVRQNSFQDDVTRAKEKKSTAEDGIRLFMPHSTLEPTIAAC